MAAAFGTFDEPHAWLIRGLVEYGWTDISRAGGYVPPGIFGAMDLSRLPESEGREGITLEVPAAINGQKLDDDGIYHFQMQVIMSADSGQLAVAVRCPEANYIQEFAYDRSNPGWTAGFVHQALTQYVPQFVAWRLAGGAVTWAQRQGIPELDGEPCSAQLTGFIATAIRGGVVFERGPQQGWWMGSSTPLTTTPASSRGPAIPAMLHRPASAQGFPVGPAAAPARGPIVPGIIAGGPIAMAGRGPMMAVDPTMRRKLLADKPGLALMVASGAGLAQGIFWFLNALSIVVYYRTETAALLIAVLGALLLVPVGAVAMYGAWKYRAGEKHPLSWVALGYSAIVPVCCLAGLPIAGWAFKTWQDPSFKSAR